MFLMLNTQVQISKYILSPTLLSPCQGRHPSPPGCNYKSSANVRQAQDTMYHPTGVRILVIHSHFYSWGGSKNHGSDKLFSNVVTLSPIPWSAVECGPLCICREMIAFGSFLLWWRCFVLWEWGDDIKVMPRRDSSGSLCHKKQRALQTACRKIKGQLDLGRTRLRSVLSIDAEGHLPLGASSVQMRDMELILTVKKSPFSRGNQFWQWLSIQ